MNRPLSVPAGIASTANSVYVLPGDVRVAEQPSTFLTILGSCVAVCLYDLKAGVGGMNHILLPGTPPAVTNDNLLRWAEPATEELYDRVMSAGASKKNLEAKVFGGACISKGEVPESMQIGARNIGDAFTQLGRRNIPVRNHDTGGKYGRKLYFESQSGKAWLKVLTPNE